MTTKKLRVFVAAVALFGASATHADTPGPDWMPKEQAIEKLSQQGYANAYLKADDGHWEGEATKGGLIARIDTDNAGAADALAESSDCRQRTLRYGQVWCMSG